MYTLEDIRTSQEIFYVLLQNYQLSEKKHSVLFEEYEKNPSVREILNQQGKAADSEIVRYQDTIYLIPLEDNHFLGYTRTELKRELCKSNAVNEDYYLSQFVILLILVHFYDGEGSDSRISEYLIFDDLQEQVSKQLQMGAEREKDVDEAEREINFSKLLEHYEALKSEDELSWKRSTKEGFIKRILIFLERQGLLIFIEEDRMIKPSEKLDRFMNRNLLNRSNLVHIREMLGEGYEQD